MFCCDPCLFFSSCAVVCISVRRVLFEVFNFLFFFVLYLSCRLGIGECALGRDIHRCSPWRCDGGAENNASAPRMQYRSTCDSDESKLSRPHNSSHLLLFQTRHKVGSFFPWAMRSMTLTTMWEVTMFSHLSWDTARRPWLLCKFVHTWYCRVSLPRAPRIEASSLELALRTETLQVEAKSSWSIAMGSDHRCVMATFTISTPNMRSHCKTKRGQHDTTKKEGREHTDKNIGVEKPELEKRYQEVIEK